MSKPKTHELRIEYRSLDELPSARANPKRHHGAAIAASLAQFGHVDPAVIDTRTGRLVAGHGRIEALREVRAAGKPAPAGVEVKGKTWLVPVVVGWSSTSDVHAEGLLVAVNRLVERGGWDEKAFAAALRRAKDEVDLRALGFSAGDLDAALEGARRTAERHATRNPDAGSDAPTGYAIRQVILTYGKAEYAEVVRLLTEQRAARGVEFNTEVVIALLRESAGEASE